MTPGARVAAAIEVLGRWQSGPEGLDRVLAAWGRESRFAGSGDRRAVADLAYDAVRRLRSAAWTAGAPETADPRRILIGSLRLDTADLDGLFTGQGHAPAPLAAEERETLALALAPQGVRLDLPDWLLSHLVHLPEEALLPLRRRAPVHLRVNTLRADRETAAAALAREGIATTPGPLSPTCLTVTEGARRVAGSRAFAEGLVEVQDAASQAVADLAAARAGETVLDFCAGGGGKTLAMAAAMGGDGRLVAHDAAPQRLAQLGPRAARAGVLVETLEPGETGALAGRCDVVLADAPCSGSGAWARNPDAKWRLTAEGLGALCRTQGAVLDAAAEAVAHGGRLVYATCSLIPAENGETVERFLAGNPRFSLTDSRSWTPLDGGDGFFAAILRRN